MGFTEREARAQSKDLYRGSLRFYRRKLTDRITVSHTD
jgi:hypothetical protein